VDKFYTVKIDEGYIHRSVYEDATDDISEAVKFYSRERAIDFAKELKKEREPKVLFVTCKYEIKELEECKNV